ncbi:sugar isomerase [Flavobacterium sp. 25HG05S-40]|uniref:sugar isomerase n=1 Tax=Flavobacterium sp. 25HG05S-40 TaxID=3458682 RepID=UPI0040449056
MISKRLSPEQFFMATMLVVNAGNYFYNLILGRLLSPAAFSDAALLITFLLVLSFLGMTFQIVTSKYAVLYDSIKLEAFIKLITRAATGFSVVTGLLIVLSAESLQELFKTETSEMFYVFGFGIPLYFIISVNRGLYQGKHDLNGMSITYQIEMIVRLVATIIFIFLLPNVPTSIAIAAGILVSFIFGLFPFQKRIFKVSKVVITDNINVKSIAIFFGLTAFYELTQIIINNSDILLVKHYFTNDEAGLYASLALIGRVVYFVAWMFVMMLLPKVIQLHKEGNDTKPVLMKYVGYIVLLSAVVVTGSFLFPKLVVSLMFGQKYLSIAPLLWKYALATSVFAVANIFAYYFLSIGKYLPVIISAILGLTQIILIVLFHNSLEQVVEMQIISMVILLIFQLIFFFHHQKK